MSVPGVLAFSTIHSIHPPDSKSSSCLKLLRHSAPSCSSNSLASPSTDAATSSEEPVLSDNDNIKISGTQKFTYSRASPSVRWPNLKLLENYPSVKTQFPVSPSLLSHLEEDDDLSVKTSDSEAKEETHKPVDVNDEREETLGRPSKTRVKKMNKLALIRAKDWRERVKYLTDRILGLKSEEFVVDVLDERKVQMTPTDYCFVAKWLGQTSWQRALEVYEWLNLRHWYSPNARMFATILAVLGKANQEALAVEIFTRAESGIENTVQVYNAMMDVYVRNGRFKKGTRTARFNA